MINREYSIRRRFLKYPLIASKEISQEGFIDTIRLRLTLLFKTGLFAPGTRPHKGEGTSGLHTFHRYVDNWQILPPFLTLTFCVDFSGHKPIFKQRLFPHVGDKSVVDRIDILVSGDDILYQKRNKTAGDL